MKFPAAFAFGFLAGPAAVCAGLIAWLKVMEYQDDQYARRWWEHEHWRSPGWPSKFHILRPW